MSILSTTKVGKFSYLEEIINKAYCGSLLNHQNVIGIGNPIENRIEIAIKKAHNQNCKEQTLLDSLIEGAYDFDENRLIQKSKNLDINIYKKHIGRPIYRFKCPPAPYDAIGWLRIISDLSIDPEKKPILIIENITEIQNQNDAELLIYLWAKGEQTLIDNRPSVKNKEFKLNPKNYTVILTWDPSEDEKLKHVWAKTNGYELIDNLREHKNEFSDTHKFHEDSTITSYLEEINDSLI